MRSSVKDRLIFTMFIALGAMLVLRQTEVSAAVIEALKSCAYKIVPSLFAMTVVSTVISRSGYVSRIFHKNGNIMTAFIFGNIGGYPIGAKLLSEMVDDGRMTADEAEAALSFCYGSGPAFSAGIAGVAIFGDMRFGIAAMAANLAANATLFLMHTLFSKKRQTYSESKYQGFSTNLMIESVSSAANSMISICSTIVFFSALRAIIESALPKISQIKYFAGVLEISNIAELSARDGVSLSVVTMLLGFGGLCVIMQVFAMVGGRFSLKKFLIGRAAALPMAGAYALIIESILYRFGIVAEAATKIRLSQSPSLIPILCVVFMVFITLKEHTRADISR